MSTPSSNIASILKLTSKEPSLINEKVLLYFAQKYQYLLQTFKLFSRELSSEQLHLSFRSWKYVLKPSVWMPPITPPEATFGQTLLRKHPRFYLFTRFLVMCKSTGATHAFRIKNFPRQGKIALTKTMELVETTRPFVAGHLNWLLNRMWAHSGLKRGDSSKVIDDIDIVQNYSKQYKKVKIFSLEPEQMLLCHFFEDRLMKLYALASKLIVNEVHKNLFKVYLRKLINNNALISKKEKDTDR